MIGLEIAIIIGDDGMFRPKSTLEQWRIFQAVVEQGGYAQAAEKLNKSQSP